MLSVRHWTLAALLAISLGGFTAGCGGGESEDDGNEVEQVEQEEGGEQEEAEDEQGDS